MESEKPCVPDSVLVLYDHTHHQIPLLRHSLIVFRAPKNASLLDHWVSYLENVQFSATFKQFWATLGITPCHFEVQV